MQDYGPLGIYATTLRLRSVRAEVLAANLANADTPGYKARDLDFDRVLADRAGAPLRLATTHDGHLPALNAMAGGEMLYRVPTQPSLDGNTVDSTTEYAAYIDNALRYQATLRFLDGRVKGLRLALTGE